MRSWSRCVTVGHSRACPGQRRMRRPRRRPGDTRSCPDGAYPPVGCGQAHRQEGVVVDFRDSPEEAAFRSRLRSWLTENLPPDWAERPPVVGRRDLATALAWSGKLHAAGWTGLTWPKEFGGQGLSPQYGAIYLEELARLDAPDHVGVIGLGDGRTDDHRARHPGAEGRATSSGSCPPRRSGARASPSRAPAPTWRACAPAPAATATTSSSTGRRCGRRTRTWPTAASC